MDVSTVIWCTGFRPDLGWIDLPVLGDAGHPVHQRGVVDAEPGLYFVGLPFQYALTSSLVGGVGRDAEHIAKHIASTGVGRDSGTAVADLSTRQRERR
jgi:putative flavoprotein involved in K+ transport